MSVIDPTHRLEGVGSLVGLFIIGAIIFAESGLLIGFFLPGDTLLFTAGFFAAQGQLPLVGVIVTIFFASIIGDNVGYAIGRKTGPKLFKKKDGIIFRQEYITKAEAFYEKHGGKTILFARFVPVIRTFAPLVAGVGHMHRKRFVIYDICGALIWTVSIVLAGFWLGSRVDPSLMERFIVLAIGGAMAITFGPTLLHIVKDKRLRGFLHNQITRIWQRLHGRFSKKSS